MSKADSAIKKFKKLIKKSKIKKLKDFVKESEKTDGVSEGGIYSLTTTNTDGSTKTTRYMLKKMDPYSMAAEYVGSHIARLYVGKSAPTVDLVRGDDGSVYVASEFIPNFQTLKDFSAKLGIPKECFPYGCVADQNGNYVPIAPHLQGILDSHHVTTNKSVSDAEKINIVAEFLQHDDTHDRNIGIIVDQNAQSIDLKATAIDWSWSLRGNNPDSPIVYYSDNYDPEKIVKAIDQVVEITPTQIKSLTEPLFDNLRECYGPQTTFNPGISPRNYLRHLASLVLPSWTPNLNIDDLQSNMISTLEKRSKKLIEEKTKIESA